MIASIRFSIILLFICLLTANVCFAQNTTEKDATQKEAERIWKLAIQAKGGREKLYSIQNVYVSSIEDVNSKSKRKDKSDFLIVYPNKYWKWSDQRPSKFGLSMEMYNLEIQKRYLAQQGQKDVELQPIEKNDPVARRFSSLIWLTLDNKWLHPVPEKVNSITVGSENMDNIQTRLNGQRIDFALDKKSHLPIVVSFYLIDSNTGKDNFYTKFICQIITYKTE